MRPVHLTLALTIAAFIALGSTAASADHNGHEFPTAEACMQSGSVMEGLPSCTRSGSGPWVARYDDGFRSVNADGAVGLFVFFALLLGLAPAIVAGLIASGRNQSVGLAALIGLLLSWLGVLIVYLTFREDVVRAARNVIDDAASARERPGASTRSATARLSELESLRADGVITEDEYAARRAAILEQI